MIRKSELTKDFYKPKEVGNMIGKGQRCIADMVRSGKLEAMRSDTNRILIPKDNVINCWIRVDCLLKTKKEEMLFMSGFRPMSRKTEEIWKDRSLTS